MKIILFQPDIAQNLGAAIRLCACFNTSLEIIEPCGFPLTAKALRRTAMDYGTGETIMRHRDWDAFLAVRDAEPTPPRLILMTTKGAQAVQSFSFQPSDWILFGRESAGVPQAVHDSADGRVIIPIDPSARSFNLVSSASITLFEALRQTGGLPALPAANPS